MIHLRPRLRGRDAKGAWLLSQRWAFENTVLRNSAPRIQKVSPVEVELEWSPDNLLPVLTRVILVNVSMQGNFLIGGLSIPCFEGPAKG